MNIHEYQAKALLRDYGVPVAQGAVAFTAVEAINAAKTLPGPVWVVKAQIHSGGRGKGQFIEPEAGEKGGEAGPDHAAGVEAPASNVELVGHIGVEHGELRLALEDWLAGLDRLPETVQL